MQITFVVDDAAEDERSGNVIAQYTIITKYTATTKAGLFITVEKPSLVGVIQIHDAKLEKMKFKK